MHPNTRACTAYVAIRLISGSRGSAVYDYSQSKYISIDGDIDQSQINIYDYGRGCYFGGNGSPVKFDLYDYGGGHYIELKINGSHFEGYDYGAHCYFSGDVNGNAASFYDYGASKYFNFSL